VWTPLRLCGREIFKYARIVWFSNIKGHETEKEAALVIFQ
jgi:hypothetical protein